MRSILYASLLSLLLLTACSAKENPEVTNDNGAGEEEQQVETVEAAENEEIEEDNGRLEDDFYEIDAPRALTEVEQEMLRKPGIYSGEHYDKNRVIDYLDQLPNDLTEEEFLQELVYLLSEDYHEEVDQLIHFDSTVEVNIERPDDKIDSPELRTAHYAILIDASGSMRAAVGNKTRMEAAKEAVYEFAKQVPEGATISLRVYGHKGTGTVADKQLSCSSSENLFQGHFDSAKFKQSLNSFQASGWTPIGLALETVTEDIPENTDHVVVYVVSDGIETCDGDPVQAAKDLVAADIETVVNIIGFDVDNEGQKLLKEVADAGNGEFTYVNSERDLKAYMREQYEELQNRWMEWRKEGTSQTTAIGKEKREWASELGKRIKEKSEREKERMLVAQEFLLKKHGEDLWHLEYAVTSYVFEKWRYGVMEGNKAWLDTHQEEREQFNEYFKEGMEKEQQYRDKKIGRDE